MIESPRKPSGAVGCEGTARSSESVVAADAGRQAEEARQDALVQAGHCARPVTLQGKQILAGPEERLDALADGCQVRAAATVRRAGAGSERLWKKIVGCGLSSSLSVGTVGFVESII